VCRVDFILFMSSKLRKSIVYIRRLDYPAEHKIALIRFLHAHKIHSIPGPSPVIILRPRTDLLEFLAIGFRGLKPFLRYLLDCLVRDANFLNTLEPNHYCEHFWDNHGDVFRASTTQCYCEYPCF